MTTISYDSFLSTQLSQFESPSQAFAKLGCPTEADMAVYKALLIWTEGEEAGRTFGVFLEELADFTDLHERTVRNSLSRLESAKMIERVPQRNALGHPSALLITVNTLTRPKIRTYYKIYRHHLED